MANNLECLFPPDWVTLALLRDDEPIAGVVYHDFNGWDIQLSLFTTSPDWKHPAFLALMFEYPFNQLDCERITAHIDTDNIKCWKRAESLGFVREGEMRKARNGKNVFIYGLLRGDYVQSD